MAKNKKVYFIDPIGGFSIYNTFIEENSDISSWNRINIGYNNSYELRSQYLHKPWFSDNLNDLKKILEERKSILMIEQYQKMLKVMEINVEEIKTYYTNCFDAPF